MYKEERVKRVWLKRIRFLHVAALILSGGLISTMVSPTLAKPPDMVKVLIGFNIQPGPSEKALVHAKGGKVRHTYHLVPAIAATLPAQAREALLRNPNVVAVDDDLVVHAIDVELDNTWGVKRIGAGTVHDEGNKGYGVRVGILDTGIDTDHPDLNYDSSCSYSFVDGETLEDGHGHGTHTAGTVAALNNDTGVVGVAPEVTLCIYKVLNNGGGGSYSDVIAALEQAVADGVQITNNSYGSSSDPGSIVKAAFDNAYAAGVLNVGASGNDGNAAGTGDNCIFPARWDSVIATAATTQSDTRASFSSTCPEVEVTAPGYMILSTVPGGGYGYMSGTSMASPHAAGTAALVLAANPGWTNDEVRLQLQDTATDLGDPGRDTFYGYGLVDAVAATGSTPPSNNPPMADDQDVETAQDTPMNITLTGSDPDEDLLTFNVLLEPANGTLSGTAPYLTYTPDPNFYGTDSFLFKVNDGLMDSAV
ncbi:MAG: hypothetical protein D3903_19985, partial [Candidatus Electrothrix sp. GM3_4]|nr:hypothetical protein [Candidatus Electrothrix sp. GM3_4]